MVSKGRYEQDSNIQIKEGDNVSISIFAVDFLIIRTREGCEDFGYYNFSKNKKYCVVYRDRHFEKKEVSYLM